MTISPHIFWSSYISAMWKRHGNLQTKSFVFDRYSSTVDGVPIITIWRRHYHILLFTSCTILALEIHSTYYQQLINSEMYPAHHMEGMCILRTSYFSTLYHNRHIICERLMFSGVHTSTLVKNQFRQGRIVTSESTRCIRAIRDTPVADYSAPSFNTTQRIAYCPPITVSTCLLALSVCNLRWKHWRCGQLWPFIGMCSLGMRLHWDCDSMGDIAKIYPCVPSTCALLSWLGVRISLCQRLWCNLPLL